MKTSYRVYSSMGSSKNSSQNYENKLHARAQSLLEKVNLVSRSGTVDDLIACEQAFDELRGRFQSIHGYNSLLWGALLDMGRFSQRMMGYQFYSHRQIDDYRFVERILLNHSSKKTLSSHRQAVLTQVSLNSAGREIRVIQKRYRKVVLKRLENDYSFFKAIRIIIALLFGALMTLSLGVEVFNAALLYTLMGCMLALGLYCLDGEQSEYEVGYWSFQMMTALGNMAGLKLAVIMTHAVLLVHRPRAFISMLLLLYLSGGAANKADFSSLCQRVLNRGIISIILLTQSVLTISLFYGHPMGLSWCDLKDKISEYRIDWCRFSRGIAYAIFGYLWRKWHVLMTHSWNVLNSQWFFMAGMNIFLVAIQTLIVEIAHRRPAADQQQSSFGLFCSIVLSSLVFAAMRVDGIGATGIVSLIPQLLMGLQWSMLAYLSGGLELSWGMHYANNFLLATLVGSASSHRGAHTPLVNIEEQTSDWFSGASQGSIRLLSGLLSLVGIYISEMIFRPKYYVEPLSNFNVGATNMNEKQRSETPVVRALKKDRMMPKNQWSMFSTSAVGGWAAVWQSRLNNLVAVSA